MKAAPCRSTPHAAAFLNLALLLCLTGVALADEFQRGRVIERVTVRADATQSYALFLPSSYSPDRRYPILYCFDPGARGRLPVELFSAAAEKYGWIVAGSNNSRNGPEVRLNEILSALWQDTHERLAIDDRRIYTTGFSGGARVATSLALAMKGQVAGVIACGAGFPSGSATVRDVRFAFFGIAGIEDFNLIELHRLQEALDKAGVTQQLITFDGDHAWPPKEVCAEAVGWMETQALKTGLRPKDEKHIAELYARALNRAQQFEQTAKLYDAFIRYQSMTDSFSGLRDTSDAAAQAQRLKGAKEVKAAVRQLKEQDRQQELRARGFFTLFDSLRTSESLTQSPSEIRRLIADLKKKAEDPNQTSERTVSRRLLTQFFIAASETATQESSQKNYSHAALHLTVAAEIRPNNPQVQFRLAAAQAQSGDRKSALEALRRAVEKGFNDLSRLAQAPEFASLREEKEFKSIIEQMRKGSGQ